MKMGKVSTFYRSRTFQQCYFHLRRREEKQNPVLWVLIQQTQLLELTIGPSKLQAWACIRLCTLIVKQFYWKRGKKWKYLYTLPSFSAFIDHFALLKLNRTFQIPGSYLVSRDNWPRLSQARTRYLSSYYRNDVLSSLLKFQGFFTYTDHLEVGLNSTYLRPSWDWPH